MIIINEVEYKIEPNSHDRRVSEMSRAIIQRNWFSVNAPIFGISSSSDSVRYDDFSFWFKENCIGYWQYPVTHTFWFSESQDVIRYYFDYHDLINFSN